MRSSVLARIPGFRQRIIPEDPHVPSRGLQARGTRLESEGRVQFDVFEKLDHECMFIQSEETCIRVRRRVPE